MESWVRAKLVPQQIQRLQLNVLRATDRINPIIRLLVLARDSHTKHELLLTNPKVLIEATEAAASLFKIAHLGGKLLPNPDLYFLAFFEPQIEAGLSFGQVVVAKRSDDSGALLRDVGSTGVQGCQEQIILDLANRILRL